MMRQVGRKRGHPFRARLEAVRMRGAKFAPRGPGKGDRSLPWARSVAMRAFEEEKGAFAVTAVNWSIARPRAPTDRIRSATKISR